MVLLYYYVWLVFSILLWFIGIPVINANSVDPDQIPHSAVSNVGLHCLPIKWVNEK